MFGRLIHVTTGVRVVAVRPFHHLNSGQTAPQNNQGQLLTGVVKTEPNFRLPMLSYTLINCGSA